MEQEPLSSDDEAPVSAPAAEPAPAAHSAECTHVPEPEVGQAEVEMEDEPVAALNFWDRPPNPRRRAR